MTDPAELPLEAKLRLIREVMAHPLVLATVSVDAQGHILLLKVARFESGEHEEEAEVVGGLPPPPAWRPSYFG